MAKKLQVLVDEEEYLKIQSSAKKHGVSVSEWVRQALRKADRDEEKTRERKLSAIAWAAELNHPTADIDVMLEEIDQGRRQGWLSL